MNTTPPSRPCARAFVVLSSTTSGSAAGLADEARRRAQAAGMETKVLRTVRVRVRGEGWDRTAELLAPEHAAGMYRALHVAPCLILSVAAAQWVRRDPSRDPPVRRAATHLEDFVRHKALYQLVRDRAGLTSAFNRFGTWCTLVGCSGDADPRVVPFTTFSTGLAIETLENEAGRTAFRRRHGPPRRMRDDRGLRWDVGPAHGRVQLQVANVLLSRGFHWDVSAATALAILTPNEVWQLRSSAYLNVDPDTRVRKTRAGSRARRIWPGVA